MGYYGGGYGNNWIIWLILILLLSGGFGGGYGYGPYSEGK